MSYKIVKDACAWRAVRWNGVAEDGSIVSNEIEVRIARITRTQFLEHFAPESTTTTRELWNLTVRDWRGVEDEGGAAVAMNSVATDDLFELPNFQSAFSETYVDYWRAMPETRLGNSQASPAGGPAAADPTAAPGITPTA